MSTDHRVRRSRRSRKHGEAGSAYVLTLFGLLGLSVLGASLVLATQAEMIMSARERNIQGTFYAAESGIAVAAARTLVANDQRATTVVFDRAPERATGIALEDAVEISHFYPVLSTSCNLCEINNRGSYHDNAFHKVNHAVTVRARRRGVAPDGTPDDGGQILVQKTLSAMIELQPWKTSIDAVRPIHTDPDGLAQIRF